MIRYLFKTKQQTGNTNNHPSWQKAYLAYTPYYYDALQDDNLHI